MSFITSQTETKNNHLSTFNILENIFFAFNFNQFTKRGGVAYKNNEQMNLCIQNGSPMNMIRE